MKRYAVFEHTQYYPSGGMSDFVAAFDTEEEAETFIHRSLIDYELLSVEDMEEYLSKDYHIPTPQEYNQKIIARNLDRERREQNPTDNAMQLLSVRLEKDLYGDGNET